MPDAFVPAQFLPNSFPATLLFIKQSEKENAGGEPVILYEQRLFTSCHNDLVSVWAQGGCRGNNEVNGSETVS